MLVSILTPTEERPHRLHALYGLLQKQSYREWEWLIYDTSLSPAPPFEDPRIRYLHREERETLGAKRAWLVEQARGASLIHCDDDDYYAPSYLKTMVGHLKRCDFVAFHSWFLYDEKTDSLFYRATDEVRQRYYHIDAFSGDSIREILPKRQEELPKVQANGFSFAYRKEVGEACPFPDCDLGEDQSFYRAVVGAGFRIALKPEEKGVVVHMMHDRNTSAEYPQYRIPPFLVRRRLADFFRHRDACREN